MSEIVHLLEPRHEVTTSEQRKKKTYRQHKVVMLLYAGSSRTKQQRLIHLKSGNFLLDFLDSEDLQDEGVVSVT